MMLRLLTILAAMSMSVAIAQPRTEYVPSADPEVEAKVQAVADTLRCVVCKNQSIADSDASLAKDMMLLVREKIEAGATEQEVQAYLVDRYGEFVLLQPRLSWRNFGLWAGPAVILLLAAGLALWFIRSRAAQPMDVDPGALSADEQAELQRRLSRGVDGPA